MLAGELGADYVLFGEPERDGQRPRFEAVLERVGWWAQVLTIPCVGYAANLDEVAALAQTGADFVAVDETIWRDTHKLAAALGALSRRVAEPAR